MGAKPTSMEAHWKGNGSQFEAHSSKGVGHIYTIISREDFMEARLHGSFHQRPWKHMTIFMEFSANVV